MLVCVMKATGELIEARSSKEAKGELINEAVKAGYSIDTIEEKLVSDEEFRAMMAARPEVKAAEQAKIVKAQEIADTFVKADAAIEKATKDIETASRIDEITPIIKALVTTISDLMMLLRGR